MAAGRTRIQGRGRTRSGLLLAGALLAVRGAGAEPARDAPIENAFPVVLGSFSTTLVGSNPDRTHNIRLAAAALDGTVLVPGDVLSFNRRVGARTPDRGYQRAPVILREARQMQLGGGICQVASTVFAAAMLAGLYPTERHRHSYPVDYIALGEDATISWGVKDLRVRNVLEQRVRLRVELLGSTLTARVEGEEATEGEYELATDAREVPSSSAGGAPGWEIEVYRVRRIGGQEVDREFLHRDLYPATLARVQETAP